MAAGTSKKWYRAPSQNSNARIDSPTLKVTLVSCVESTGTAPVSIRVISTAPRFPHSSFEPESGLPGPKPPADMIVPENAAEACLERQTVVRDPTAVGIPRRWQLVLSPEGLLPLRFVRMKN